MPTETHPRCTGNLTVQMWVAAGLHALMCGYIHWLRHLQDAEQLLQLQSSSDKFRVPSFSFRWLSSDCFSVTDWLEWSKSKSNMQSTKVIASRAGSAPPKSRQISSRLHGLISWRKILRSHGMRTSNSVFYWDVSENPRHSTAMGTRSWGHPKHRDPPS
jgi:hypothetical protein